MSMMDIPIDPALLAEEQGGEADMEDAEGELVDEFLGGTYAEQPEMIYVSVLQPPLRTSTSCLGRLPVVVG